MRFLRKCPCVQSFKENKFRYVNIVLKENMEAPTALAANHEWARKDCPQCQGRGVIQEEATGQIDVESMKRDFQKRLAKPI